MEYRVPVIVEPLDEGGYYAECPLLQGCHVEGKTYLEALENLQDAIRLHIEGRLKFGDPLPPQLTRLRNRKKFSLELPVAVHS
jgi:predicted RNase H-like HicB family nuclease